jgi:hypothetical protein
LEWRGWEVTEVQANELSQLHWYHPPGAPRELLHAYVNAARVSALGPNQGDNPVRVVILKTDTTPDLYADLLRQLEQPATAES